MPPSTLDAVNPLTATKYFLSSSSSGPFHFKSVSNLLLLVQASGFLKS